METKTFLGSVYLFSDLNEKELEMIKNITNFIELNPGQKLFSENDESDSLYIIKYGSVIVKKGTIVLSILADGECIGEITFLNKEKRTATVTAIEKSFIFKINYDDLETLLNAEPIIASKIYKSMAKTLSKRLKDISENIEKRFQPTKFI